MDPKKGNKLDPNNKKKFSGFLSIILWALLLTILFNTLLSGLNSKNTVTVLYSDFRIAVEAGAVELVDMSSSEYTFYLKDGWSMTAEGELTYTEPEESDQNEPAPQDPTAALLAGQLMQEEKITYNCAPWSDADLIPMMAAMNANDDPADDIAYGPELLPQTSFIVELLMSYVLPIFLNMKR